MFAMCPTTPFHCLWAAKTDRQGARKRKRGPRVQGLKDPRLPRLLEGP